MLFIYNKNIILIYILFVIFLHVIPTGSAGDLSDVELGWFRGDYLIHMAIFLPWMGIVRYYLSGLAKKESGRTHFRLLRSPISWLFIGIVLAAGAEVIHYWIPHRTFNIMDMIFNISGVLIGSVAYADKFIRSRE